MVKLLRAPPFPGIRNMSDSLLLHPSGGSFVLDDAGICLDALREHRVGGDFWAAQPVLPQGRCIILRQNHATPGPGLPTLPPGISAETPMVFWTDTSPSPSTTLESGIMTITGPCDPWHMLSQATAVICDETDELAWIAAIVGVPVHDWSGHLLPLDPIQIVQQHVLGAGQYRDPFSGEACDAPAIIRLLGFWRKLIDDNRGIAAGLGFAFWKQDTVAPLLWSGGNPVPFVHRPPPLPPGSRIAVWKSRTAPDVLQVLETSGLPVTEVEDGFIRSAGLGADCVPPLSITVDRLGAHFDPSRPSELEELIQHGPFTPTLLDRARELRALIVRSGISKYAADRQVLDRPGGLARRHVLVTGQVEDDRSVLCGGGDVTSNLELLRRARAAEPDAFILYKPHPDVEAGHRIGAIPDQIALTLADRIVRDQSITALIDMVDGIHVNTSLAGFEALMRSKDVTTHGVPFYAGWGLTRDLGEVPARRRAHRTLDELVAAVLLLYPRYLDPVTGLPCPPEVLVRRLVEGQAEGQDHRQPMIVHLRRLQGRLNRLIKWLIGSL